MCPPWDEEALEYIVGGGGGPISAPPIGDISTGLIGWWPMNTGNISGTQVSEISGAPGGPRHATMNGSGNFSIVTGPGGLLATALKTNGAGIASYSTTSLFDWTSGSFSAAIWFNLGDLLVSGGGSALRFWSDDWVDVSNFMEMGNNTGNSRPFFATCNTLLFPPPRAPFQR
jgi:hypothetical protein